VFGERRFWFSEISSELGKLVKLRSWAHAGLLAGAPLACLLEPNPSFDGAETRSATSQAETTSAGTTVATTVPDASTTQPATTESGTGGTGNPSSTDSSSSESGDPSATCSDGTVVAGERCHVALAGIPLDVRPRRIAAADLDADGWPDVAVAGEPSLAPVLFGVGGGVLAPPEVLELSQGDLDDVEIADVDGDAQLDLVFASSNNGAMLTMLGPIAGGMATEVTSTGMGSPRALGIGRFTNTGMLDVLYVNGNFNARVGVGNGDGGFVNDGTVVGLGTDNAQGLVLAELDGDREWIDAVVLHFGPTRTLSVVHGGAGGPTAGASHQVLAGAVDVTTADLDGDGILELVSANRDDDSLSIVTIAPGPVRLPVAGKPVAVGAADFDLDGNVDLAIVHQSNNDNHLALLYGDGSFAPTATVDFSVGDTPVALAIADFDADTIPDVAVAADVSEDVHVVASSP